MVFWAEVVLPASGKLQRLLARLPPETTAWKHPWLAVIAEYLAHWLVRGAYQEPKLSASTNWRRVACSGAGEEVATDKIHVLGQLIRIKLHVLHNADIGLITLVEEPALLCAGLHGQGKGGQFPARSSISMP